MIYNPHMFLHLEDWTVPIFLEQLKGKGFENINRLIKIYASQQDPRQSWNKPDLTIFEVNDSPFTPDELYTFPDRDNYTGADLENRLAGLGLTEKGQRAFRTLFRFSYQEGFTTEAMLAKKGENWLIEHPFEVVDEVESAIKNPRFSRSLHLDIFFPDSIRRLEEKVGTENELVILGWREAGRLRYQSNPPTQEAEHRRSVEG